MGSDFSKFQSVLNGLSESGPVNWAVGLSGGPDSMALLWLMSEWAAVHQDVQIHALIVDHGLRAESPAEAALVMERVSCWPCVQASVLRWEGGKPETRILEEARAARYGLMKDYMARHAIRHLFIAHHQDDQAETFLMRLCAGSGLDGLAAMGAQQEAEEGIVIVRPLLGYAKEELVALCDAHGIAYVTDPTNGNERYARPRLRAAREVLEEEGLTAKRLSVTAGRLSRARGALNDMMEKLWADSLLEKREGFFSFDFKKLAESHEELLLRLCLKAAAEICPDRRYAPRLERMEELVGRILREETFKSATLGGCLFAVNRKNATMSIGKEE